MQVQVRRELLFFKNLCLTKNAGYIMIGAAKVFKKLLVVASLVNSVANMDNLMCVNHKITLQWRKQFCIQQITTSMDDGVETLAPNTLEKVRNVYNKKLENCPLLLFNIILKIEWLTWRNFKTSSRALLEKKFAALQDIYIITCLKLNYSKN